MRNKLPTGKTIYLWQIKRVAGGDPEKIADLAVDWNLSAVMIKAADGIGAYNLKPPLWTDTLVGPLTQALRDRGIGVWGWQYIWGKFPIDEANRASERVRKFGFDGWIVDAEAQFDRPGMDGTAARYMDRLRFLEPDLPIGISSYRYPDVHPYFPWGVFLRKCDFNYPQVYWVQADNPSAQIRQSYAQFIRWSEKLKTPMLPYIPVGAAYEEWGWQPTPDAVKEFAISALQLGLKGYSFWEWAEAIEIGYGDLVAGLPNPDNRPVPEPEPEPGDPTIADLDRRLAHLEEWAKHNGYVRPT